MTPEAALPRCGTAGLLVNWLDSGKPDLLVGVVVFAVVVRGAVTILRLGK